METAVVPLSQDLADNREHSSPPEGLVSQTGQVIIHVTSGQAPTPLYYPNKLIILLHLIEIVLPPFLCVKRGSCVLTLPFVKTVGPEL